MSSRPTPRAHVAVLFLNRALRGALRPAVRLLAQVLFPVYQGLHQVLITPFNRRRNARKQVRRLEIGPGAQRIPGFETMNVRAGRNVDYVGDAAMHLPFQDGAFDFVYASHVIEHIPWHQIDETLAEWARVLKPGGVLEVWLPDGYKLAQMLCDIEAGRVRDEWKDGWRPLEATNPYLWINGRLLYGLRGDYPSWHRAIITPKSLHAMFKRAGLIDVLTLEPSEFRSVDHGWINLGMRGRRP